MKFDSVKDSFNYWNSKSIEDIERRSQEIKDLVENDEKADVVSLKIELEGIAEVKKNREEKKPETNDTRSFSPIGSMGTKVHKAYESKEYRNAYIKHLQGRELNGTEKSIFNSAQIEYRADNPATSSNTGAVIPTQLLNEIVSKARTMGGILAECRAFSVPSNIEIPVGTPTSNASWHTEANSVDVEKPTIANVKFTGNEIMKVFRISKKVESMSIPAFESYLTEELSNAVMGTLAVSVVSGTGSSQGKGILNDINCLTYNYSKTNGLVFSDIPKIIAKLKRGYSNGAKFAVNNSTLWTLIYPLSDSNGRPIFINDTQNDSIGKLAGFPVVVDDNLPDGTILFGNFNYMGYNLPEGIAVESSRESGFTSGTIDYRALAVADTQVIVPEAFVIATKEA